VHKGFVLWFTGLSGAGKSTISNLIEARLPYAGAAVEVLDGDASACIFQRSGLQQETAISISSIGFVGECWLTTCDAVSRPSLYAPYAKRCDPIPNFVEVYVECPSEVLAERDVKGLYKALAGGIPISRDYRSLRGRRSVRMAVDHRGTPEKRRQIWATLEHFGTNLI
jgi:adenylylsulfate kinase